jgi:predicted nucleic acid-binding protein
VIFVDTSFWVAAAMRRDDHHPQALALARTHAGTPWVTSNHVRGETWTFLRRRAGHAIAVEFVDRVERSPRVQALQVAEGIERDALSWLRRHDEREYSFVDATSFALMADLKIRVALAFDGDFAAAGFTELRPV